MLRTFGKPGRHTSESLKERVAFSLLLTVNEFSRGTVAANFLNVEIFRELFRIYGYLPITTDSHLGEYIQWAYSVADHDAILDFYDNYKAKCLAFYDDKSSYDHFFDPKNIGTHERVIPIIEGILSDSGYEEAAVNIPNRGYIACLPRDIVVEVPGNVNKSGIHGVSFEHYPSAFGSLLTIFN